MSRKKFFLLLVGILVTGLVLIPLHASGMRLTAFSILEPITNIPGYAGPFDVPTKLVIKTNKPSSGLGMSDFEVKVGDKFAVISAYYEAEGVYILEVIPPQQSANGSYDLIVTCGADTDTEQQAIRYAAVQNVDVGLVIDVSGSMYADIDNEKSATSQFVDIMQAGDQAGVVSFSEVAQVEYPLTMLTTTDQEITYLKDDVEGDSGIWTVDSPWVVVDTASHSPTHSWAINPYSETLRTVQAALTSGPLDLSEANNPYLQFWYNAKYIDFSAEISLDGGLSWTPVFTDVVSYPTIWRQQLINIDDYAGESDARLRFYVDDYVLSSNYLYLDDITLVDQIASKTLIKKAIELIELGSITSIGAGLQSAQQELTDRGDPEHPHAIVLMTDGQENTAPWVADVLSIIIQAGTVVHTVGLGGVDEEQLQEIAAQTGGTYHLTPDSGQLAGIYNTIAGAVTGQQQFYYSTGTVPPGGSTTVSVAVDTTTSEATFSLNWVVGQGPLVLTLQDPNGLVIDPAAAAADPDIGYVSGLAYAYYQVKQPIAGVWQMNILAPSTSLLSMSEDLTYTVVVSGWSNLTLNVYSSKPVYGPGEAITLVAVLSDEQPILGASVNAEMLPPTGVVSETLTLLDEDQDGIYIVNLDAGQSVAGNYVFNVTATGESNTEPLVPFTRQEQYLLTVGYTHQVFLPLTIRR